VNSIRWLSSGRGLGIGTSGGAFVLSSGTDFVPLTPDNVQVRRETGFGAQLIIPKRIGNFTYYIQRGGRKLREFAYNFDIDSHRALDMTLLAEHITESGVVIIDYQQSPNSILWTVRDDGQIATMTRQIDQEVIAWTRIVTGETSAGGSKYESLAVIPIPNAENDQVWVSVQRTVGAVVRRYIEFYSDEDFGEKEDAFFVDSGLTFTGGPATVLTGLDHLEGESVDILSEGAVIPAATVVNGSITLEKETTKAHIGLGYTSELKSLRIEAGSALGTSQGKIVRVYEVVIRFFESLGGELGREGFTDVIKTRKSSDPMDASPPLFTGDKRIPFPKGYDREARVFVKQEQPLPMTILAIMPKMEVFDR